MTSTLWKAFTELRVVLAAGSLVVVIIASAVGLGLASGSVATDLRFSICAGIAALLTLAIGIRIHWAYFVAVAISAMILGLWFTNLIQFPPSPLFLVMAITTFIAIALVLSVIEQNAPRWSFVAAIVLTMLLVAGRYIWEYPAVIV